MAIKAGLTMTKNRLPQVLKAIRELAHFDVLVGYPSDSGEPKEGQAPIDPNQRKQGAITNAALGYIHENGAPEVNIPARPHLLPGVRIARSQIADYLGQAGRAALAGEPAKVNRCMHAAGLAAQTSVRQQIRDGSLEPLKESTIRRRMSRSVNKRKGIRYNQVTQQYEGVTPLIDTGQMIRAISYIVRENKS